MKTLKSLTLALLFVLGAPIALAPALAPAAQARDDDEPDHDEKTQAELEEIEKLQQEGLKQLTDKAYPEAIATLEKTIARIEKSPIAKELKDQAESLARYNLACGYSLSGKKDEAIKAFARSVELGFWDWKHIEEDTDLDNVRKEEGFKKAIENGKALEAKKKKADAKGSLSEKPLFAFDFTVKTLDGKTLKLSELKGKAVIVDIWGTWCPPCRKEIPHFVKLYADLKAKGLEIVGLACEQEEDAAKAEKGVKEFAEKNGILYPLASITEDGEVVKQIPEFEGFPTTLFVDKSGKVRAKLVGYTEHATLEALAEALLEDGAAKPDDAPKPENKDAPKDPKKDSF